MWLVLLHRKGAHRQVREMTLVASLCSRDNHLCVLVVSQVVAAKYEPLFLPSLQSTNKNAIRLFSSSYHRS